MEIYFPFALLTWLATESANESDKLALKRLIEERIFSMRLDRMGFQTVEEAHRALSHRPEMIPALDFVREKLQDILDEY